MRFRAVNQIVFVYNQSFFRSYKRRFPHTPTLQCSHVHRFRLWKLSLMKAPSCLARCAHINLVSHYFHCLMYKWMADSSHNAPSCRVPQTPESEIMTWAQRGVDPIFLPSLNVTRHFWLLCLKKKNRWKWEMALCSLGQTQVILSFLMKYSWNEVSGNFSLRDWKLVQVSYHSEQ